MKKESMETHRPAIAGRARGVVLEVGFGSGLNLPYYKDISKLYALEPSKESFELSDDLAKDVSFPIEHLEASAEKIPLMDQSVDSVISTWTLCTIPDPQAALKEIARVLKPGGEFIFIEHGASPHPAVSLLQKIGTPFSKRAAGGCHLDRDIEGLIKNSGLTVKEFSGFPAKLRPLIYMYKGVAAYLT